MSDSENNNSLEQSNLTFPASVNDLRVGGNIILKSNPCRIVSIDISKTGKHGHAKASVTGLDIFTDKKYEQSFSTGHPVQSFIITRKQYQVLDIVGSELSLLDSDNNTRNDMNLPNDEELSALVIEYCGDCYITVMSAVGRERIVECRKN